MNIFPGGADKHLTRWPTDIAVAIGTAFLPASLLFFINNPAFYTTFGLHTMLVMAFAVTLPVHVVSHYIHLSVMVRQKMLSGHDTRLAWSEEFEWNAVRVSGSITAVFMYPAVAVMYFYRVSIGGVLLGVICAQVIVLAIVIGSGVFGSQGKSG